MSKSYFSAAFRWCETENTSPIENYTTEMFVFLWEYVNNTESLSDVAQKLSSLFIKEGEKIKSIKTQVSYEKFINEKCKPKDQVFAIPDISINLKSGKIIVVEVKVDQNLNTYLNSEDVEFDQIDYYQNIENVERVYLLSKNDIDRGKDTNKYRWRDIYSILKKEESNYLIKDFISFLDENGMGEPTPLKMNDNDFLKVIKGFSSLLHDAWQKCNISKYYLSKNTYATDTGFGYYIKEKGTIDRYGGVTNYFLGINHGFADDISFWVEGDYSSEENFILFEPGSYITSPTINIKLNELSEIDPDKQVKKMTVWLEKYVKRYFEK